jgi:hypothetical protein
VQAAFWNVWCQSIRREVGLCKLLMASLIRTCTYVTYSIEKDSPSILFDTTFLNAVKSQARNFIFFAFRDDVMIFTTATLPTHQNNLADNISTTHTHFFNFNCIVVDIQKRIKSIKLPFDKEGKSYTY